MAVNGRNWAQVRECVADLVRQLGEERDLPWTGLLGWNFFANGRAGRPA